MKLLKFGKNSSMQLPTRVFLPFFALSLAFFALSCSFFEKSSGPELQIVVGDVTHTRDGDSQAAVEGQRLEPHDGVVAAHGAKLKVSVGPSGIFVNEESSFKVTASEEGGAIVAEKGEYYFSARDGNVLVCQFGDMSITMTNADASFVIAPSRRLAYLCVINGRAKVTRGGMEMVVSACEGAVLDAAGVAADEAIGQKYSDIIERLKGWVGEITVERAVFMGKCRPAAAKELAVESVEEEPDTPDVVDIKEMETVPPRVPVQKIAPLRPVDTAAAAKQPVATRQSVPTAPAALASASDVPAPASAPRGTINIEHIIGPKQVYVDEEFTLRCTITGTGTATGYVWKIRMGGDFLQHKTAEPQITTKLNKAGEYSVACEVLGEDGTVLAAQLVKIMVISSQTAINAGGPYSATQGKPVRMLGNARSRGSTITQYEWYITSFEKPDAVSPENAIVQHIFTNAGQHRAIFKVKLSDGTTASDTAIINVVAEEPPTAKAGETIVSAADTSRVAICSKDMVTVAKGKFCIDKYEWPNQHGAVPLVNVSWHEAAKACENAGKRLCTASEWKRACRNDSDTKPANGRSYPYGDVFDRAKCNVLDNPKSKNAVRPSGSFSGCAGSLSIFDMSGNAAEWVTSTDASNAPAYGGFYQSGAEESDCDTFLMLDKERNYPYVGFRCCK
jgi:hypothetical protein